MLEPALLRRKLQVRSQQGKIHPVFVLLAIRVRRKPSKNFLLVHGMYFTPYPPPGGGNARKIPYCPPARLGLWGWRVESLHEFCKFV